MKGAYLRKIVCQFELSTEIYDTKLPQKIQKVLASNLPDVNQEIYYGLDVVFNNDVYKVREFYQYKLDRLPMVPPQGKNMEAERSKNLLSEILSQQLSKIVLQVGLLGFDIDNPNIIGNNMSQPHSVSVVLYENAEKIRTKSGKPNTHYKVSCIVPDQPYIQEIGAKRFAELILARMKKDAQKEYELSRHTPNWVKTSELFDAIASAILSEKQVDNDLEIKDLSKKLRINAVIESDWPLKIVAGTKAEVRKNPIDDDFQIDCPEYLLYYQYQGGHWELEKIESLKAAQDKITKSGFNLKRTANIILLHQLQRVDFTLLEEVDGCLIQISKENAVGKKKLSLSWYR